MIRLLLADDQAMVRTGFRMILDAQPDLTVVGEAGDGRQAVEEARRLRPDTALMDIRMPGMDGVEATRRLAGPGVEDPVRVIVLTTFDLDDYVVEALRAGASGFLLKDAPAEVLLDGIRAVGRGDALLAPPVTRRLIDRFVASYPRTDRRGRGGPGHAHRSPNERCWCWWPEGSRTRRSPAGSTSAAANDLPVLEDGLCTSTQEYHMNLDAFRPVSDPAARGKVHGDAPPSDNAARVPVLPVAVAVAAAVAVGAALGAAARRAYNLDA